MLLSTAFSARFHTPHCASLDGDGDSLLKIIRMPVADASPTTPSVLKQRMPGSSWPRSLHARPSAWLERLQGIGNDRLETTLKRARHMFAAQLSDHGLCLGLHNAAVSRRPEPADKPIAASQEAISGLIHTRLLKLTIAQASQDLSTVFIPSGYFDYAQYPTRDAQPIVRS